MPQIELTQGKFAIVDDEDFEWLNQWRWQVDTDGYAVRHVLAREGKKGSKIRMHRAINKTPTGLLTDHINGNRLDNRKENLRNCTTRENTWNSKSHNNTSGYKGVTWDKRGNKWKGHIRINNLSLHLGYFTDVTEAAKVYDSYAIKYFGEYAKLNFPNRPSIIVANAKQT